MSRIFNRWMLACWVVLVIALVTLTPLLAQGVRARDRDPDWLAPAAEASKVNPLANRTDAVAGGRKLFQQRCSTCHGEDGGGTKKAPDLRQPDVQAQTDGALFWKISGGNAYQGMPSFSFLPEPQRWQLVLHLRTFAYRVTGTPAIRLPILSADPNIAPRIEVPASWISPTENQSQSQVEQFACPTPFPDARQGQSGRFRPGRTFCGRPQATDLQPSDRSRSRGTRPRNTGANF